MLFRGADISQYDEVLVVIHGVVSPQGRPGCAMVRKVGHIRCSQ